MGRRTVKYSWVLLIGSLLFTQNMMNRLRAPIVVKGEMNMGYDNNFLRLSDKELKEEDVTKYGISSTLDSPIVKPTLRLIYSPKIIDRQTTNIVTSVSYSHFTQSIQKSYLITNLSLELKLRSYSWLKLGMRDIPKYYLRNYHDRDLSNDNYYHCTFSSQKYYGSFSYPVKWIHKTWIKIYIDFTKEYYNSNFTEFDLNKFMLQADFNYRMKKKYRLKLSLAHGNAENISYGSNLLSVGFDRSYIFDKVRGEIILNIRNINAIDDVGISMKLEQRYYDLLSEKYFFDNWKFYLDGMTQVWVDWDIMDKIGLKTSYQFRWRDTSSKIYGDFDWVEDIKSYTKHEIWLKFSYEFTMDILY